MMIADHGWRVTYWAAGALCFVAMIPLARVLELERARTAEPGFIL
jgi:predicted MFS family arabinose efflux permease